MKLISNLSPFVCAAIAAAAFAASANAEPQRQPPADEFAFKFSYDPAHLNDAVKAEQVLERLERAVRRHCQADIAKNLQERRNSRACVEQTMTSSMDKFGSTLLTQVYQTRAAG